MPCTLQYSIMCELHDLNFKSAWSAIKTPTWKNAPSSSNNITSFLIGLLSYQLLSVLSDGFHQWRLSTYSRLSLGSESSSSASKSEDSSERLHGCVYWWFITIGLAQRSRGRIFVCTSSSGAPPRILRLQLQRTTSENNFRRIRPVRLGFYKSKEQHKTPTARDTKDFKFQRG
jgi:hypothetical protein